MGQSMDPQLRDGICVNPPPMKPDEIGGAYLCLAIAASSCRGIISPMTEWR